MKRIAVVGSGIAGLTAAYVLSRRHEVHLYEKDSRLGGHTHTVFLASEEGMVALDTGFLVHNRLTYPRLSRLFAELGVETLDSEMSFSVSWSGSGLEYSSRGLRGFFAQRRNAFSAAHHTLLREIFRFNRVASAASDGADLEASTVGDFLCSHRFHDLFSERYLLPMAAAIWSSSPGMIREFPVATLLRFLGNHGLLAVNGQPAWKVVRGGSHTYIPLMTAPLANRVHTNVAIREIRREPSAVRMSFFDRPAAVFDEVVLACHGDQVLPLLADPTDAERDVFSAFRTTTNRVWLHTDRSMLPAAPDARASWNYRLGGRSDAPPAVTYDLNRLQSLATDTQFCVTLNPQSEIDERQVIRRMTYAHPLYTHEAIRAQQRWSEVSGVGRTHYAGAYWFYGFHEDGVRSAERVARSLGVPS